MPPRARGGTKIPPRCIDCEAEGIKTRRKPATGRGGKPVAGNRCVTHNRAKRRDRSEAAAEKRWMELYGITADEYSSIYEHQNGVCYICRRSNGKVKRLSVDHDHATGFVRGLLCSRCNRDTLGNARDEIAYFERAIEYLKSPPAFAVIGQRFAPVEADRLTRNGG